MFDMGTVPRLNHPIKRCFLFSIGVAVYPHPPSILHESVPLDVSVLSEKVGCHFISFEKNVKAADHADFKALGNTGTLVFRLQ
jgi:hypothetical protein